MFTALVRATPCARVCFSSANMSSATNKIKVMTSGASTAAFIELVPQIEVLTKTRIVTMATSIGMGKMSIPNWLKHREEVRVIIVADAVLKGFIKDGLVLAKSYTPLVHSSVGMAMRADALKPDISLVDALRQTLLQDESIAYSASVSGQHLTQELYQRLGIADEVMGKSRLIGGGERVGAVIARGEAEIGFQQMSELLPVPGIAYMTPLPLEAQKVSTFSAGIGKGTTNPVLAQAVSHSKLHQLPPPPSLGAV